MRYHLCHYKRVKVLESTIAKLQRSLQKAENLAKVGTFPLSDASDKRVKLLSKVC